MKINFKRDMLLVCAAIVTLIGITVFVHLQRMSNISYSKPEPAPSVFQYQITGI